MLDKNNTVNYKHSITYSFITFGIGHIGCLVRSRGFIFCNIILRGTESICQEYVYLSSGEKIVYPIMTSFPIRLRWNWHRKHYNIA